MKTSKEITEEKLSAIGYDKKEIGAMSGTKAEETLMFIDNLLRNNYDIVYSEESNPYIKQNHYDFRDRMEADISEGKFSLPKGGLKVADKVEREERDYSSYIENESAKDAEIEI